MANYTHKAIINTFEEMLIEMPFDKITVSALVERCEISPNTFYYHFKDIYDLLDSWILQKKSEFGKSIAPDSAWTDILKSLLAGMRENAKLVNHLMKSLSRDRVENFSVSKLEEVFYEAIKKYFNNQSVSEEDIKDLAEFCCYSTIGCIFKFIHGGMAADIDRMVDKLHFRIGAVMEKTVTEKTVVPKTITEKA